MDPLKDKVLRDIGAYICWTMPKKLQDVFVDNEEVRPWARGEWDVENQLRGRWLHSDIRDVAYPFVRKFYFGLLEEGCLK